MTEKQKDAEAKDFCKRASAQETAELLARECAEAIADSDVIDVPVVLEIINEHIPLVELLNIAQCASCIYQDKDEASHEYFRLQEALGPLRAKLPKGEL